MSEQPLVIRLSLEHMQSHILQAIWPREVELKERVEQAVQATVDAFNFDAEVERMVASTLHNEVQRRVSYAVLEALRRRDQTELDKLIEAEVERQLRKNK